MLWTASLGPLASPVTLSQTSRMAPQSSEVRFSSVALAKVLLIKGCYSEMSDVFHAERTNGIVKWADSCGTKHGCGCDGLRASFS